MPHEASHRNRFIMNLDDCQHDDAAAISIMPRNATHNCSEFIA